MTARNHTERSLVHAAIVALYAHHDPRPCLVPPDWSKGYTSIFALQQEEASPETMM